MTGRTWFGTAPFFLKTALWTTILLVVPLTADLLRGSPLSGNWTIWEALHLIGAGAGLFLPFSAFAGGLGESRPLGTKRLALSALTVSGLSLSLLGFASPHLEYRAAAGKGIDVTQRYPTGPATIRVIWEWRARVVSDPPEEWSLSVERPFQNPPNWLGYLIHSSVVLALFAILSAFLGSVTAGLTTGLSPPARRNARWAIGLASGVLFFVAEATGGEWVRADPQHSGVLGAWLPLLLPMAELGLLYLLLHRSRRGSTLSQGLPSYD